MGVSSSTQAAIRPRKTRASRSCLSAWGEPRCQMRKYSAKFTPASSMKTMATLSMAAESNTAKLLS